MNHHRFGKKSAKKIEDAHPHLQGVIKLALEYSEVDFGVSEVKRSLNRQKKLLSEGSSVTLKSRHLPDRNGECHAVDVYAYVNGKASYQPKHMKKISKAFFKAAIASNIQIEWGGHWTKPFDMPHYQLCWKDYPPAK